MGTMKAASQVPLGKVLHNKISNGQTRKTRRASIRSISIKIPWLERAQILQI